MKNYEKTFISGDESVSGRSKTVLLMISSLGGGGAQRQMVLLANQLSRRNYKVILFSYHDNGQLLPFLDKLVKYQLIDRSNMSLLSFLQSVYRLIRSVNPDCIISYLHGPNLLARILGRCAGIKNVITSERNDDLLASRKRLIIEILTHRLSSKILFNANFVKDKYQSKIRVLENRFVVINNGVDTDVFQRKKAVDDYENISRQEDNCLKVLIPARIEEQKNHRCAIKAIAILERDYGVQAKLECAGNIFDKGLHDELTELARTSGMNSKVRFLGPVDNIVDAYIYADAVLLPSLWEGFPNSVIEAMACESIVVASDVSDVPWIVNKGINGFIFNSGSAEDLARQLAEVAQLTTSQRREVGSRARARALELCDLTKFTDKYINLLGDS